MLSLVMLFEDAFQKQIEKAYKGISKQTDLKIGMFDQDALQLGVVYECGKTETLSDALLRAMKRLSKDPHCYDDVIDVGQKNTHSSTKQVTWAGHPNQGMRV